MEEREYANFSILFFTFGIKLEQMNHLILLRHGEAEPSTGLDFNRHLTLKGKTQINLLGQILAKKDLRIDRMYCSLANRTYETAEIINDYIPFKEEIYTKNLYSDSHELVIGILEKLPDEVETCLLIGHNPSISLLASFLGSGDYLSLQPGMMVILELETNDWKTIGMHTCSILEVLS